MSSVRGGGAREEVYMEDEDVLQLSSPNMPTTCTIWYRVRPASPVLEGASALVWEMELETARTYARDGKPTLKLGTLEPIIRLGVIARELDDN